MFRIIKFPIYFSSMPDAPRQRSYLLNVDVYPNSPHARNANKIATFPTEGIARNRAFALKTEIYGLGPWEICRPKYKIEDDMARMPACSDASKLNGLGKITEIPDNLKLWADTPKKLSRMQYFGRYIEDNIFIDHITTRAGCYVQAHVVDVLAAQLDRGLVVTNPTYYFAGEA